MPLFDDRILETTAVQGTGTASLLGAQTGLRAFRDSFNTDDEVFYLIEQDKVAWEVGIGTLTEGSPDTLSRDTIITSSTGGGAINFGPGTKNVACLPPSAFLTGPSAGFSATTRPAWLEAGGAWVDKTATPWIVKLFDGTDDIPLWSIDPTANLATPYFEGKLLPFLPRNHFEGLVVSNNSVDSAHDLDITAGRARDAADAGDIVVSALTKRMDVNFVEGTNQGGLDAGALAADTDYDVYAIGKPDGTGDIVASTAASALVRPAGFDRERRAASFRTDGAGNIINKAFRQVNARGEVTTIEVATTAGTSVALAPMFKDDLLEIVCECDAIASNTLNQPPILRIGPAAGVENSGYDTTTGIIVPGSNAAADKDTDGIYFGRPPNYTGSEQLTGVVRLRRLFAPDHLWTADGRIISSEGDIMLPGSFITLSGALATMAVTTPGGAATLNNGRLRMIGTNYI